MLAIYFQTIHAEKGISLALLLLPNGFDLSHVMNYFTSKKFQKSIMMPDSVGDITNEKEPILQLICAKT